MIIFESLRLAMAKVNAELAAIKNPAARDFSLTGLSPLQVRDVIGVLRALGLIDFVDAPDRRKAIVVFESIEDAKAKIGAAMIASPQARFPVSDTTNNVLVILQALGLIDFENARPPAPDRRE